LVFLAGCRRVGVELLPSFEGAGGPDGEFGPAGHAKNGFFGEPTGLGAAVYRPARTPRRGVGGQGAVRLAGSVSGVIDKHKQDPFCLAISVLPPCSGVGGRGGGGWGWFSPGGGGWGGGVGNFQLSARREKRPRAADGNLSPTTHRAGTTQKKPCGRNFNRRGEADCNLYRRSQGLGQNRANFYAAPGIRI